MADEDIHPALIEALRTKGWDVLAVAESKELQGKGDEALHRIAATQKRLLVTADGDYQDDRKFPLQGGPGILILVGKDTATQWEALRHAGPRIQRDVDMEPNALPWNKFIASPQQLRCRGKTQSGELFDEVLWQARPARPRGGHRKKVDKAKAGKP